MITRVRILLLILIPIIQTSFVDDDSGKESSRQKRFRINNDAFGGGGRYDFFPLFPLPFFNKKKKTR